MGKHELSEITNKVFEHFGLNIDYTPLSVFEYLLNYYDNSIQIDSWQRLASFIDGV